MRPIQALRMRNPASPAVWTRANAPNIVTNGSNVGSPNQTLRFYFGTAIIVSGSKVRLTMRAISGTSIVLGTYIQTKGAGQFDFSATPIPVTWGGGSSGFTISAGTTIVSDEITFAVSGSSPLVVSVDNGGTSNLAATNVGANGNHARGYINGHDATTLIASGYNTFNSDFMHLNLEIYH